MAVYVYDDNRIFLSTPSARRATKDSLCMANLVYISIHALREEGDPGSRHPDHPASISIHALREEGDASTMRRLNPRFYFYPRPPRGGRPMDSEATCRRN